MRDVSGGASGKLPAMSDWCNRLAGSLQGSEDLRDPKKLVPWANKDNLDEITCTNNPFTSGFCLRLASSAQLLFSKVKSVEYTKCNDTVVIPCKVLNVEAQSTEEMYVKWKLNQTYIFIYDGSKNNSTVETNFSSAKISVSDLLKGDASLKMGRTQAVVGNYTCEVTELSREGKTVIELKHRMDSNSSHGADCSNHTTPAGDEKEKGGCTLASWFSPNEKILIVIFPILAILLFWGKFGILTLKYKSTRTNKRIILLLVAGTVLTVIVIVGAILLIPAFGMASFTIAILITQVLGYVLALVGLCLCIMACEPVHGPLLISGLGIIALAELLGLVYMKFVGVVRRSRRTEVSCRPSGRVLQHSTELALEECLTQKPTFRVQHGFLLRSRGLQHCVPPVEKRLNCPMSVFGP
ncbi:Leukocyte surface antigen CD47 [Microtus ochrogaster]|uniref:Leukocyte surface antigen CD47 n=1 Tax=Microtus ochrogaster TaxID=79684 RepID=A0A8J6L8R9_MICOH|nr:Leukocyte surface antigen CD47 [Microtus ochrogaster]